MRWSNISNNRDTMMKILLLLASIALMITYSTPTHAFGWISRNHHRNYHQGRSSHARRPPRRQCISATSSSVDDQDDSVIEISRDDTDHGIGNTRRTFLSQTTGCCVLTLLTTIARPSPVYASYIDPKQDAPVVTKRVYLDIEATGNGSGKGLGSFSGRITIGLFGDVVPKLAENFETLCKANAYAGTTFYRVVSDFSIQGGAIGDPTGRSGRTAADFNSSSNDSRIGDEDGATAATTATALLPDNYNLMHTMTGLVSMVNGSGGAVDSRFFINVNDNGGWGDDRYAVFGIIEGDESFDLIKKIERVKVKPPTNKPIDAIMIVKSGVL